MPSETKHVLRDRTNATADTMVKAFAEDPVMSWIFNEPETRQANLRAFMYMACERSISVGHAFELADGGGAALWCPPEVRFFTEEMGLALFELLQSTNGIDRTEFVLGGLEPMGDCHPDEPHFYLADIGVEPSARGKGNGARLLKRVLETCDDEGIVAYLESSNPRNISLYERAGFEVTAELQLPEGPVLRPMTRQPH